METGIIPAIDSVGHLLDVGISNAAELLTAGELVAFPTETVYGLGANALDADAVNRIFEAKGRPSNNPLIVHVSSIDEARDLVDEWPQEAQLLAEAFWPGPLTLVLKKKSKVPSVVTGGGDTVAIRIPAHPVALELIRKCGFPLAAPSANKSNQLSPTTAEHVRRGLGGTVKMILDGGPCESGIESTVLNLTSENPTILRPGVLSANFLSEVTGKNIYQASGPLGTKPVLLSPGQLRTHYAPQTPLTLVTKNKLIEAVTSALADKKHVAVMTVFHEACDNPCKEVLHIEMPPTPEGFARDLYAVLHHLDEEHRDIIICEMPPDELAWAGVRDRLSRAGEVYRK